MSEEKIDELISDVENELKEKPVLKTGDKQPITNSNLEQQSLNVPGIGDVDLVDNEELDITLEKFEGVIFRVQNCLFRVCYIDKAKGRFTSEVVNLKKSKKTI